MCSRNLFSYGELTERLEDAASQSKRFLGRGIVLPHFGGAQAFSSNDDTGK